ncbi:hypothetical protein CQA53_11600 [Helicobacter didelphidarum]|uniref:Lipoprotein n=1 Tax=Helicobacter didelphidarum TaxID=2040648 RepID=A0A3D8I3T6_9HELI|nr:hypothetical protein [Helicobacter didelphidarum]RDU59191.1 hypothetical protein CQA53_11600 [Helicobacter didelphidarum]
MKMSYSILSIIGILVVAVMFSGCFVPYSFQPSYHKFKKMCELDPEIYQFNGGKIDEEYYNKVLKYFDTSLDKLDWEYIQENLFFNDSKQYVYQFKKYDDRITIISNMFFKDKNATKDNIRKIGFYANWRDLRPFPAGNEGTGFYLSGSRIDCSYFHKEIE